MIDPQLGEHWSHHADGTPVLSIADLVRKRAAATPAAVALEHRGRRLTCADLDARSNQVANALLRSGVRPGDRVVYLGANSAEELEVVFGAAKAGAIATPVNNRLAPREIASILADAEPSVVVTDRDATPLLAESTGRWLTLCVDGEDPSYAAWRDGAGDEDPGWQADPDETGLILFTSGTTGLPKGIELSGRNLGCALLILNEDIELATSSVCAAPVPFFHIAGLGLALAATLNGARLLLDPPTDTLGVLRQLVDNRVTHAVLVPTVLQRLLALPEARDADWSALSYVVYGASPIPEPVLIEATEVIGCKFLQSYGLTESTGGFTLLGPEDHLPPPGKERRRLSAGRPVRGALVRVVDPETLEDVPVGTRGEVLVAGSRLMRGYWRRPEATAEVKLADGWLRTGDGGSFDADGYLYLHDRLKDMIITGGENVYPAEVESVMTGHPAIAEVAVVGVPSDRWGESPVAVVTAAPGATVDEAEVIAWTRDRLAHFKCPVAVHVVEVLPRTPSGKLQKAVLREQLKDRTPVG